MIRNEDVEREVIELALKRGLINKMVLAQVERRRRRLAARGLDVRKSYILVAEGYLAEENIYWLHRKVRGKRWKRRIVKAINRAIQARQINARQGAVLWELAHEMAADGEFVPVTRFMARAGVVCLPEYKAA